MTDKPSHARILYKISGEALMGAREFGIDPDMVAQVVEDVLEARALGVDMALAVGGGNIFRGVSLAQAGADRVTGDHMGMLAIVMNALALRMAFDARGVPATVLSGLAVPQVCETFSQRALATAVAEGAVVIFAGGLGTPFFTSDTAAAVRAAEYGADAIFKGTQVDGVYSADPRKEPQAARIERISHDEVLERRLAFMDASAVALARDRDIDIVVFSIHDRGALAAALTGTRASSLVSSRVANDDA